MLAEHSFGCRVWPGSSPSVHLGGQGAFFPLESYVPPLGICTSHAHTTWRPPPPPKILNRLLCPLLQKLLDETLPHQFFWRGVNDSAHVSGKYCYMYFLSFLGDKRQSDSEKSPGRKREHDALKNFKGNSILNVLHSLYYFLLGHTYQPIERQVWMKKRSSHWWERIVSI